MARPPTHIGPQQKNLKQVVPPKPRFHNNNNNNNNNNMNDDDNDGDKNENVYNIVFST